MSIFLDASVIVALMTNEPGSRELAERFDSSGQRVCSWLAMWEASRAIARKRKLPAVAASAQVEAFLADFNVEMIAIGAAEGRIAIQAHDRYGKGTGHRANLNMGDCFAYACARTNNARLLYKGDDFSHTDLA